LTGMVPTANIINEQFVIANSCIDEHVLNDVLPFSSDNLVYPTTCSNLTYRRLTSSVES
jgi:hypothetical protein